MNYLDCHPALWYAFFKVHGENLTDGINWSFDGEGTRVPPDAIVDVEVPGEVDR